MRKFLILSILLMFVAPAFGATIYKWVDEKGVVNFTDEYKRVPPAFRNRVETEEYLEEEPPSQARQEVQAESDDWDAWNKQLEEATLNYEKALDELLNEGEKLVWHRYGSKTQYQMFTAGLPSISERLEAYREQVIEARDMLDKLSREDQEREDGQREKAVSSVKNGGDKTDVYGRDEIWWKEKVRPWRKQLEEAVQDYEEACDAFVKQAEALGPFRFGRLSLTQYQMISTRLTDLTDRMAKDQTEISEARGVLSKLSREAKEAKADPAWLEWAD